MNPLSSVRRSLDTLEHNIARLAIHVRNRLEPFHGGRLSIQHDGMILDPELQALLFTMRLQGLRGLSQGGVEAARSRLRRNAAVHTGPRTPVSKINELSVDGAEGPLAARLYRTDESGGPHPLIVFFHGGGFVLGDLDTHDEACRMLCRHAGAHVLSVAYRLAPEHPFPAAAEDALAALRWAQRSARELGADPARIAVAGDSAGGNLATVACMLARDAGDPLPCLQLLIYPCTDSSRVHESRKRLAEGFFLTLEDIDFFTQTYLGKFDDLLDPRVSPLRAKALAGLPPALVATAGFDPLRDEGEAYAQALQRAGCAVEALRMPSLVHGFINLTGLSRTSRNAYLDMAFWARRALARATRHQGDKAVRNLAKQPLSH